MILSTRRPIKLPNTILKSALGLTSLWPNHTIKHVRSWWTRIQVMASYMTAPSHYLKQCGLIIILINKVLWHLSQQIIIKDLKKPISKMRLKLVCWYNFTPSRKSFIYSAVIFFVMLASCHLLSPSLIFQAYVYSRGTRYPPHVSFVTTPQGGNVPRTYLLHEESVTWKIMTSSVKAKIWRWLTAVAVAKKINSGFQFQFQFQFQGFQFQFHFQFHQFQFQFQFRNWNWNWPAIPIPELNWPQPW